MSARQKKRLAKLEGPKEKPPVFYVMETPEDMPPAEALRILGHNPRPQDWVITLGILKPGATPYNSYDAYKFPRNDDDDDEREEEPVAVEEPEEEETGA